MNFSRYDMLKFVVIVPSFIVLAMTLLIFTNTFAQYNALDDLQNKIKYYLVSNQLVFNINSKNHILNLCKVTNDSECELKLLELENKIKTALNVDDNKKISDLSEQFLQINDSNLSGTKNLYYEIFIKTEAFFNKQISDLTALEIDSTLGSYVNYLINIEHTRNIINLQQSFIEYFVKTKQKPTLDDSNLILRFDYKLVDQIYIPEFKQKNKIISIINNFSNIDFIKEFRNNHLLLLHQGRNNPSISNSAYWIDLFNSNILILNQIADIAKSDTISEIDLQIDKSQNKLLVLVILLVMMFLIFIISIAHIINQIRRKNEFELFVKNISSKFDRPIDLKFINDTNRIFSDINDRINNLIVQKQLFEDNADIKNKFYMNTAHELNIRLNGIASFLDLLKQTRYGSQIEKFIQHANEILNNTSSIICNILNYSAISNAKISLEESEFLPLIEFEKIAKFYAPVAADKNINFIAYVDPNLANIVVGDLKKIKTIMLNLIDNAIKFTPSGGEIEVMFSLLEYETKGKNKIYFKVRDNGIGIDKATLDSIFDNSLVAPKKNSSFGLGLSICLEYLKMMSSNLSVKTQSNIGSEFSFTIDFKEKSQGYEIKKFGLEIAILSSNPKSRYNDFLKRYFKKLGIYFKIFENAKELNNANQVKPFDAVFMRFENYLSMTDKITNDIIVSLNTKILKTINFENKKFITISEPICFTEISSIMSQISAQNSQKEKYKDYDKFFKTEVEDLKDQFNAKALVYVQDKNYQCIFKYILNDFGIRVEIQSDPNAMKQSYYNDDFDIIFIDIAKSMTTAEKIVLLIKNIESKNGVSGVPLIGMIDNANMDYLAKDIGFNDHIIQPITSENVKTILDKFITHKKIANPVELRQANKNKNIFKDALMHELTNTQEGDILIFRESLILNTAITKKFETFCDRVTSVTNLQDFEKILNHTPFSLIFVDFSISKENINNIISIIKKAKKQHQISIKTLLLIGKDQNFPNTVLKQFDKIIQNEFDINQISISARNLLQNVGENR